MENTNISTKTQRKAEERIGMTNIAKNCQKRIKNDYYCLQSI